MPRHMLQVEGPCLVGKCVYPSLIHHRESTHCQADASSASHYRGSLCLHPSFSCMLQWISVPLPTKGLSLHSGSEAHPSCLLINFTPLPLSPFPFVNLSFSPFVKISMHRCSNSSCLERKALWTSHPSQTTAWSVSTSLKAWSTLAKYTSWLPFSPHPISFEGFHHHAFRQWSQWPPCCWPPYRWSNICSLLILGDISQHLPQLTAFSL